MRRVAILFNEPVLPDIHPDYASEAGVLESVEAFATALGTAGYAVKRLGIGQSLPRLVERLTNDRPDVVVNFCEGFSGRSAGESYVTGLLELLGVPYTGSSPECLSLVRDKVRTKRVLRGAGIPTADFWVIPRDASMGLLRVARELREQLSGGKLFVKPAAEDASLGIDEQSVVADWAQLESKVIEVQRRFGDALVERYLDGREFNVGVIAFDEPETLPIAEIEFQTANDFPFPIVTYAGKWREESAAFRATPVRCPADVDEKLAVRIREVALAAFTGTGCRDCARVDFRVTPDGGVYVLEVNANPDLGPAAGFARALGASGIEHGQLVRRLVEAAVERGSNRHAQTQTHPCPPSGPDRAALDREPPASRPGLLPVGPPGLAPSAQAAHDVRIRPLVNGDKGRLLDILAACQMFRRDEIDVAEEIINDAMRDGENGDYRVLVAETGGQPVGWSCHGRVPLTDATFDLYWIAVHPEYQRQSMGRMLLAEIERQLTQASGRWLLAETSSTSPYEKTRGFYERAGFSIVGDVADFYRAGDGRITYGKRIQANAQCPTPNAQ
jgi:D-alanine-D-alanine ligase